MSEVFRIHKTIDITVMSNHHLRNTHLTLRAKGLLSLMLSLPPSWDYSLAGLAKISREGTSAISAALKELDILPSGRANILPPIYLKVILPVQKQSLK